MPEQSSHSELSFADCVNLQVAMLDSGKPLDAFDRFFAAHGTMYANDEIFADSAEEGRRKQEPFILAAQSISGLIIDLKIVESQEICIFRNRSSFTTSNTTVHQIDGLCWQKWHNRKIIEERYYDGEQMLSLVENGILSDPGSLSNHL